LGGGPDTGDVLHDADRAASLTGVAADLGDGEARRQRLTTTSGDRQVLDEQPGDGLAVVVEQPADRGHAGRGRRGEQRARCDEAGDPGRDLAVRQVPERVRVGRPPAGHRLHGVAGGLGAAQAELAAPPGGGVLEGEPGPV
jgi:hypothetical protein